TRCSKSYGTVLDATPRGVDHLICRVAIFLADRPEIGVPPWSFALDLDHGVNAGAILDDAEVVALQSASEDRSRLDRGVEHPRQIDVDAVDGLAGHLERNIAIFLLRPDQCELIRSFDLDVFRIWQRDRRRPCG